MSRPPKPRAFATPAAFRVWLEAHGAKARELVVRCFKVQASRKGMTYRQALDEALCAGWIDGVRHGLDATSFSVRFTPRKPRSAWSSVNVRRARQLEREGRLRPAGLAAFRRRVKARYSFESRPLALAPAYLKQLRANRAAGLFFEAQPPWYRRVSAFWVMSAKRPEARAHRLQVLIASCQQRRSVPPLERAGAAARSPARPTRR